MITIPHSGYVLPSCTSLERLLSAFQHLLRPCSCKHSEPHLACFYCFQEVILVRYPGTDCGARGVASSPVRWLTAFYTFCKSTVVQGRVGQMAEPAERVSAINALSTVNVRWLFFFFFESWNIFGKYLFKLQTQSNINKWKLRGEKKKDALKGSSMCGFLLYLPNSSHWGHTCDRLKRCCE